MYVVAKVAAGRSNVVVLFVAVTVAVAVVGGSATEEAMGDVARGVIMAEEVAKGDAKPAREWGEEGREVVEADANERKDGPEILYEDVVG